MLRCTRCTWHEESLFVVIGDHLNDPLKQDRAARDNRIHGNGIRKPNVKGRKAKKGCPILDTGLSGEGGWRKEEMLIPTISEESQQAAGVEHQEP